MICFVTDGALCSFKGYRKLRVMKTFIQLMALLLCFVGCTESKDLDCPNAQEIKVKPALIPVDLSHTGLPLLAKVPPIKGYEIDSKWNETFGRLELRDAYGMDLFIQESTGSCADKKREIEASIFDVKYDFENDSILCYTTSLPDGTPAYCHIFGSFAIGSSNYTFENNPLVECNSMQIAHMKSIIENIELSEVRKR